MDQTSVLGPYSSLFTISGLQYQGVPTVDRLFTISSGNI
jgi:hypothetical protein